MSSLINIYQRDARITRHAAPERDKWGAVTTPGTTTPIAARVEVADKLVVNDVGERVVSTARAYVDVATYNAHAPQVLYDLGNGSKRRVISRELQASFEDEYGVLHFA